MELKRTDVEALEAKLQNFASALPEQEQHILNWIVARAKAATEVEIRDEELENVAGGIAGAAGFDSLALEEDSVSVSGTWTRG